MHRNQASGDPVLRGAVPNLVLACWNEVPAACLNGVCTGDRRLMADGDRISSMSAENELEQTGNLGTAWLFLCLSFATNILDQALNDFLGYYNATVLTLYGHFSWFPLIDLTFREWLVGMIAADAILLLLTPLAYRNSVYLRPLAYAFGVIMVLFGCGTVFASLLGRTVPSVHFTGMAPGTYSAPLLVAASVYLLWRLRASSKSNSR